MLLNIWIHILYYVYYLEQLHVKNIFNIIHFLFIKFLFKICSLYYTNVFFTPGHIFWPTNRVKLLYYTVELLWLGHYPQTWANLKVLLLDSWGNLLYLHMCLFSALNKSHDKKKGGKKEQKAQGRNQISNTISVQN